MKTWPFCLSFVFLLSTFHQRPPSCAWSFEILAVWFVKIKDLIPYLFYTFWNRRWIPWASSSFAFDRACIAQPSPAGIERSGIPARGWFWGQIFILDKCWSFEIFAVRFVKIKDLTPYLCSTSFNSFIAKSAFRKIIHHPAVSSWLISFSSATAIQ